MRKILDWLRSDSFMSRGQVLVFVMVYFFAGWTCKGLRSKAAIRFLPAPPPPVRHFWLTKGPLRGSRAWARFECLFLGHVFVRSYVWPEAVHCLRCLKVHRVSGL